MTPTEAPEVRATVARLMAAVEDGVDVDRVLAIGRAAPPLETRQASSDWPANLPSPQPSPMQARPGELAALECPHSQANADRRGSLVAAVAASEGLRRPPFARTQLGGETAPERTNARRIRIAVARDAAFGFYYADDLEAFERAGAKLCFFDALSDARLPDADGLFIGGGFPETQAAALEANASLRDDIARRIRAGLPTYAECGGMMYLARSIRWKGGTHEMVGAIPADAVMHERPQGRGLALLQETGAAPWPLLGPRAPIPAHEFHYAALENLAEGQRFAYRVARGTGIAGGRDGIAIGNLVASFCHQRASPRNPWVERFVAFVRERREKAAQPVAIRAGEALALHV
jgi:cobyrinic acid a,c-diamide synthase